MSFTSVPGGNQVDDLTSASSTLVLNAMTPRAVFARAAVNNAHAPDDRKTDFRISFFIVLGIPGFID